MGWEWRVVFPLYADDAEISGHPAFEGAVAEASAGAGSSTSDASLRSSSAAGGGAAAAGAEAGGGGAAGGDPSADSGSAGAETGATPGSGRPQLFDLTSIKGFHAWPGVENRSDTYWRHSSPVGLKERGGRTLEVKLRNKTKKWGAEKWKKWKLRGTSAEAVSKELASLAVDGEVTLARILGDSIQKVEVSKRRRGIRSSRFPSVQIEQTDFEVSGSPHPVRSWRTICVEGEPKEIRPAMELLLTVLPRGAKHFVSGGYPAWVEYLFT